MRKKMLIPVLCLSLIMAGVTGVYAEEAVSEEAVSEEAAPEETPDEEADSSAEETADAEAELPEGVVPVTWDVSEEHLMIEGDEARELYERIVAKDYPPMEELKANHVVQQLDALSDYYMDLYGNTAEIDTPERIEMRQELIDWFLTLGSARQMTDPDSGREYYVYDGELKKDYQMELVLGLPASGKSTFIVDPDSEAMGAFVLDPDVIKAQIPEYIESHGAASDAIHYEGMNMFLEATQAFLTGDLKGTNVVLPIVSSDLDGLMSDYIKPFEEAGYNVKVKFREAEPNEAAARVVMRELRGGQLIRSDVAFNFGYGPQEVYEELAPMINAQGETYGFEEAAVEEEVAATEEAAAEEEAATEEAAEEEVAEAA